MKHLTENKDWPHSQYKALREGSLCQASQLNSLIQSMLYCGSNMINSRSTDHLDIPENVKYQRVPPEISEINIFDTFKHNPSLVLPASKTTSSPGIRAERSQLYKEIMCNTELSGQLTSVASLDNCNVRYQEITRMHQISNLAHSIRHFAEGCADDIATELRKQIAKSKRLQPYSYEEIICLINEKKEQKPDKKVYVFLYNEWHSYFNQIYAEQKRAKTDICGAQIIYLNKVYFGWRDDYTSPPDYSALVLAEDEIEWNLHTAVFSHVRKIPRRLQLIYGIGYQHKFKFL